MRTPMTRRSRPSRRSRVDDDDDDVDAIVPPEIVAQSLTDYVRAWVVRLRSGDSGLLPVVVGLILIAIIFQALNSNFLSAGNLVNLLVQGSVFMLLAMAEVWVLLLGEIDLSAGFVGGVSGVIMAEMLTEDHGGWPWYAACIAALVVCALIGAFHGTLITRIGLPSFVVTLAGLLGFQGVMLLILGNGGTLPIQDNVVNDFANGNLTVTASWAVAAAVVVGYGLDDLVPRRATSVARSRRAARERDAHEDRRRPRWPASA